MKNLDQYLKKFDKDVIKSKKAADKAANEKKIDESQKKDKFSETEKPPKKNRSEYVGFIKEAESSGILAFDYYNYKNIILLWVFIGVFFFSFGLFNSFIADKSFIIILFTVFVILYLITLLGYHTNYLLNLKSNELMKVYNLFSLQTDKLIADFREIKLIGVSTVFEVKNERVGATKNYEGDIVYFLEVNNLGFKKTFLICSAMFDKPNFDENFIEKETNTVKSEFEKMLMIMNSVLIFYLNKKRIEIILIQF